MEGGRGPAVLLFWPTITLLLLVCGATGRYLRFEPGFEYQYKYHSDAKVHTVDTFTMKARVSGGSGSGGDGGGDGSGGGGGGCAGGGCSSSSRSGSSCRRRRLCQ